METRCPYNIGINYLWNAACGTWWFNKSN
uniref:Uncharacterized protein n=1 Tax=Triticum urartu TaxID=4572 RepID=A0A8R7PVG9_TRIUA